MAVKKLYFFDGGYLSVDKSIFVYRTDMGTKISTPVNMALIETDEGYILYDTGLHPFALERPEEIWGDRAEVVLNFDKSNDIRNILAELGLSTGDISYVINSHLHWDHSGGNQFFSKSAFLVQKAEYRYALYPDSIFAQAYLKNHFDHPLNYQLIEGDKEIMDGVSVISSYGHTPGHQSLFLDLPKTGKAILVGDAIYTWENIEKEVPAGNCWNPVVAMESHYKVKHLADKTKGKLFITHDPNFWKYTKKSPEFYE
jgi:N-acyl homoserine lactone hydrolase